MTAVVTFILGFAAGAIVWHKFGAKIRSFIKKEVE